MGYNYFLFIYNLKSVEKAICSDKKRNNLNKKSTYYHSKLSITKKNSVSEKKSTTGEKVTSVEEKDIIAEEKDAIVEEKDIIVEEKVAIAH